MPARAAAIDHLIPLAAGAGHDNQGSFRQLAEHVGSLDPVPRARP